MHTALTHPYTSHRSQCLHNTTLTQPQPAATPHAPTSSSQPDGSLHPEISPPRAPNRRLPLSGAPNHTPSHSFVAATQSVSSSIPHTSLPPLDIRHSAPPRRTLRRPFNVSKINCFAMTNPVSPNSKSWKSTKKRKIRRPRTAQSSTIPTQQLKSLKIYKI